MDFRICSGFWNVRLSFLLRRIEEVRWCNLLRRHSCGTHMLSKRKHCTGKIMKTPDLLYSRVSLSGCEVIRERIKEFECSANFAFKQNWVKTCASKWHAYLLNFFLHRQRENLITYFQLIRRSPSRDEKLLTHFLHSVLMYKYSLRIGNIILPSHVDS